MRLTLRFAALPLVALVLALLVAPRVARAEGLTLVSSTPSEGATVAPPEKIALTFSAPIDAKGMTAWITDANGTPNANALCPQVTGRVSGATATLVVPPKALRAGLTVAVLWTARAKGSSDAPQSGKLTFTVGAVPALVGSTPSAAATIASPPESITLSFDQALAGDGTSIAVTVDGRRVAASAPSLDADGKTVTVTLTGAAPGQYQVTWSVKSRVGIPTRGMVRFTAQ